MLYEVITDDRDGEVVVQRPAQAFRQCRGQRGSERNQGREVEEAALEDEASVEGVGQGPAAPDRP